jgi:hypothetical protein
MMTAASPRPRERPMSDNGAMTIDAPEVALVQRPTSRRVVLLLAALAVICAGTAAVLVSRSNQSTPVDKMSCAQLQTMYREKVLPVYGPNVDPNTISDAQRKAADAAVDAWNIRVPELLPDGCVAAPSS